MLSEIPMIKNYEFKKNDYPFIYYFDNEQIEWNPKKDIADIIREIYNKKDIKISKYNGEEEGLFTKPTVVVESRKKLSISADIRLQEHLRTSIKEPRTVVPKPLMVHSLSFE